MKYQKLEKPKKQNWKWIYLIRKHREGGKKLPRYEEKKAQKKSKVQELNRMSELS